MSNESTKNKAAAKKDQSGEKIPQRSSKKKTPKQVMGRHIRDEKDVITEEEFKELAIGDDATKGTEHEALEIEDNKNRPKDEDKDPKIITPWDVINP